MVETVRSDFIPALKDRSDRKTHTNLTALKNRSNRITHTNVNALKNRSNEKIPMFPARYYFVLQSALKIKSNHS